MAAPSHDILAREVPEILAGEDADLIEHLWQKLWWALHYGGRGGPTVLAISAVDMALWDLKAKRAGTPLWRLLGGYDRKVPCYAGGIDLDLPLDALLRQTDAQSRAGLSRDQDEGRSAPPRRGRGAGRRHAAPSWARAFRSWRTPT